MDREKIANEIQDITRQIIEKYQPEKIILFGSAADSEADEVNDLDFLIVKSDVPRRGRDRMRELRHLINKHMAADFLIYNPEELDERERLRDPFILSILQSGKKIYG